MPPTAWAAGNTGVFTVTGGSLETDYSYSDSDGVLTILTSSAQTIVNTDPNTGTTDHILVKSGGGRFSTGPNGNAVIYANSITDTVTHQIGAA